MPIARNSALEKLAIEQALRGNAQRLEASPSKLNKVNVGIPSVFVTARIVPSLTIGPDTDDFGIFQSTDAAKAKDGKIETNAKPANSVRMDAPLGSQERVFNWIPPLSVLMKTENSDAHQACCIL